MELNPYDSDSILNTFEEKCQHRVLLTVAVGKPQSETINDKMIRHIFHNQGNYYSAILTHR